MSPAPLPSTRAFLALMPDLRRSARRLARSAEEADDLVQETLLRVWSRITMAHAGHSDAAPVTDLRAYAFATMRNCARTRPRAPDAVGGDAINDLTAPPDIARAHHACGAAVAALKTLPDEQAVLLRMRGLEGLSYREIARRTGLPLGTVTSRLSRGRMALREALGMPSDAPVSDLFRET